LSIGATGGGGSVRASVTETTIGPRRVWRDVLTARVGVHDPIRSDPVGRE
jgi:hypothetical protein